MTDVRTPEPDLTDSADLFDQALMRLIAHRDHQALGDLYDRHGRLIYSLVLAIIRDLMIAEEVTQDLFLKVWQRHEQYDSRLGSVRSWLVTLSRNLAIDRLRSKELQERKRISTAQQSDELAASVGSDLPQIHSLGRALAQVGPPYEEALRLAYFDGLTHRMIADQLRTPLGTIKSRIRDGLVRLRQLYVDRVAREELV